MPQLDLPKAIKFLKNSFPPEVELLVIDGFNDQKKLKFNKLIDPVIKIADNVK